MQMLGAVDSVGEDEIPSADFDRFRPLRIVRRGVAESESLLSNDDHFIDEDVDSRNDELSDTENLPAIEGPDLGDLF